MVSRQPCRRAAGPARVWRSYHPLTRSVHVPTKKNNQINPINFGGEKSSAFIRVEPELRKVLRRGGLTSRVTPEVGR